MRAMTPAARTAPLAVLAALVGSAVVACDRAGPEPGIASPLSTLTLVPGPAGPGSGEPNLTAGGGAFHLSWLEATDGGHALRLARWEGDDWSEPITVLERDGLFVNWADFPSILALDNGTLVAHWLQKSGPGTYHYDVRMALSRDGGASWSGDIVPHRDGLRAEHGFVSLFPLDDGIGVVWLDGRETVRGGPMTLRFTTVGTDGSLSEEVLLDDDVCDCCQTGAAVTSDGPVVVYRGRTAGEVRDIHVTRRVDGEWTDPRTVHDDDWVIPACPVNGPAIDAAGRRVAVAWFTAAGDGGGRVLLSFSDDAGASFGEPVPVDDGAPMGRVDVTLLPDGAALVTWLERTGEGAEIRIRRVSASGLDGSYPLAETRPERASGFPRMVRLGNTVMFAWTEPGPGATVRTALGRLSDDAGPGAPVPAYSAVTIAGSPVTLENLRGEAVLLNVWATWCAPCRQEIPELQALHERHGEHGLRVVGVTVDSRSEEAAIRDFMDELGITYDIWWDPDQTVLSTFEAVGVPLTLLIGPDGRTRWRHTGILRPDDPALARAIRRTLAEVRPAAFGAAGP